VYPCPLLPNPCKDKKNHQHKKHIIKVKTRHEKKVGDRAEHHTKQFAQNERIKEATTTFFLPRLIKSRRRKLHSWSYNNR